MDFPKLHIFLGAGGVGKTTLSAAFAVALANSGKKVGLLSIDPAKRLQSALGIQDIGELGTVVPLSSNTAGQLRVAVLHIDESFTRWVEEKGMPLERQERLLANPYFAALANKIASSTETFAAIRVAEWVEQYPDTEVLVIDTAPGIHAIDFITKPEKLTDFLDSKFVHWLKWFARSEHEKQNIFARFLKSGTRKIIDGLALIGGRNFLLNFGEFLTMLDEVVVTALARLQFAQEWFKHASTQVILVSAVREDAGYVAKEIARTLRSVNVAADVAILNRCFPESLQRNAHLQNWLQQTQWAQVASLADHAQKMTTEELFVNYLLSYQTTQQNVFSEMLDFVNSVVELPISMNLDMAQELRFGDLSSLGALLNSKIIDISDDLVSANDSGS